jgi:formate-dependent nitrite reductase cytochrome c552 subunit
LFVCETADDDADENFDGNRRKTRKREHFWLCGACSVHFTLYFDSKLGMLTVPLSEKAVLQLPRTRPLARIAQGA